MAFGIKPPAIAEWIVNLGEAAEYMFDHNIFQDNLVGVDFCEQMVKETNPSRYGQKAEKRPRRRMPTRTATRRIGDIMTALNPFSGTFYLEALQMSRMTREMFCLMEGRHVHPSTLYPGGVGTVPTVQLFTDYIVRLMKYVEFMKKVVPLHDDLFDFFYEALPGYENVGRRRILLGCWGSFNNPEVCDYTYKNMTKWGRGMYVTPGVVVDGELVTNDLVDINLNIRILLGSSYYDDWQGSQRERLSRRILSVIPWTSGTHGTRPLFHVRRSATSTTSTPGSCLHAGSISAREITWRSIPAAARSRVCGRPRSPESSTSATSRRPATASKCTCRRPLRNPKLNSSGRFPSGATQSSVIAPAPTSRFTPPAAACISPSRL